MVGRDASLVCLPHFLLSPRGERKVLVLSDSKPAIAVFKRAGRTEKARSRHLQEIVNEIAEDREVGGRLK